MFVPSSLCTTFSIPFDRMTLFPRFLNGRIQVNIDIVEMLTEKKDADMRCGNMCVHRVLKL